MNSSELAIRVVDCLSDGYDDEENREEAEIALYNELSQLNGNSTIKAAILRLCEINRMNRRKEKWNGSTNLMKHLH